MSPLLRCANGHEWEGPASESAPGEAPVRCPACGALSQTVLSPSVPAPAGADPADAAFPRLSGYEILEELGRGGMGIVYKARQTALNRVVALKVIRKERLAHAEAVGRFRREAQAAARLSHPNIVAVYEYDQDGDTHYLAMEYVPGLTLQSLVEQSGPLPVELACDVIRQAALGVQHAAEQALVHRDIKPANLMLLGAAPGQPLPPRPLVKILDMGVARLYQLCGLPEDTLTTLTRDGAVIGTPDFVAPEQLEDPHGADVRADLYSLGCTFYFILSGRVPFPGGTLIQKLDRQRWETPPSVDQLRRDVPPSVAAVVRRLMAKHPDDRYHRPTELIEALEQLARSGVVPAAYQSGPLRELLCLRGHQGGVHAVAFTADGTGLVSGGADGILRLWDVARGAERGRFGQTPLAVACVAVLPRSGHVAAGQGAGVRIWDPATGREVHRLGGHGDAVRSLSVSADGSVLLSGGEDRTLRLWDTDSGREVLRLGGHRAGVTGVALSGDGRLAVSASRDQTLRLWDVSRGRELRSFPVPRGPVLAVAFARGDTEVLSAHFDTTLRLWDVATGRELRRLAGHRQMVAAAVGVGRYVASAGHDQTVRLWEPDSGAELSSGRGHSAPVLALAASADGQRLASAALDGTVRLWEVPAR